MSCRKLLGPLLALGLLALVSGPSRVNAQGLVAPGAGPINLGMAGASTAAPIDFGSSYWNPANISGLDRQEFLLGSQLVIPSIHLRTRCFALRRSLGLPARRPHHLVRGTEPRAHERIFRCPRISHFDLVSATMAGLDQ